MLMDVGGTAETLKLMFLCLFLLHPSTRKFTCPDSQYNFLEELASRITILVFVVGFTRNIVFITSYIS